MMEAVRTELVIICVFAMLTLVAMSIDFVAGWHKAKTSGTARKSQAMKRSVGKFIHYEGAVMLAGIMDVVINVCGFWKVLHVAELHGVPVVCALITLFLVAIEIKSLNESASQKEQKHVRDMLDLIVGIVGKDKLGELVGERLKEAGGDKVESINE